jgi:hypothetical protein
MTLQDIIADIHALTDDLEVYERKYGILSATFYDLYQSGAEPEDDAWVLDWADWAGAYKIFLRRHEQYRQTMQRLQTEMTSLSSILSRTARHEPISVST